MIDKLSKVLSIVFIVLSVLLLFVIKLQNDKISTTSVEMKQLQDNWTRVEAEQVKDLEEFAKNSNLSWGPIKEDLNKLNAEIKSIGQILVSTPGYSGSNLPSTQITPKAGETSPIIVPCPNGGQVECPDMFGYLKNTQILKLEEPFVDHSKLPFGEAQFNAWQSNPWALKVYPRDYSITSVLGEDEDGKHYVYSKFEIITNGKTYPVKISKTSFVEEKPSPKFRVSPRLYLNVEGGSYLKPEFELMPNLQMAIFSYGQTKIAPTWTFLGIGVGYASKVKTLGVVVSPVSYNIAQHLPFVENLYVGPSVMLNTNGDFAILGGLGVGL